jgi:hypothetical protein
MVVAQIGVGEDIVADRWLSRRPPQWPIISHASGRSTARWSVIVFALDGPDADIDEGDAGAALGHQVIGRHLVRLPHAVGDTRFGDRHRRA